MKEAILKINRIDLLNFDPKESKADFKISFLKSNEENNILKSYKLENPEFIVEDILKSIKKEGKIEIEDDEDLLGSIFVVRLLEEEKIEEKILAFLARLCEKSRLLKREKNYQSYMKLFDEMKTQKLAL